MAKPCGCGSKKGNKVSSFSDIVYIVKDAAGNLVREFGNKPSAAREVSRHPGYTLHPVQKTQSA